MQMFDRVLNTPLHATDIDRATDPYDVTSFISPFPVACPLPCLHCHAEIKN